MRRLLAYLFIVLGLGLTFNVNANVIIEKFIMEFENLDKQFDKLYNGHEEFNYATKSENFNIEKCNLYLSKIEKQSSTVNESLALIKKMQKDGIVEQINEDVITRYLLKLSEYEDQFNKVKNNKFDCNGVKTAKAEPSQTQKVANKELEKKIIYDVIFCKLDNKAKPVWSTISTYAAIKDTAKLKCPKYKKKKIKFENILNFQDVIVCIDKKQGFANHLAFTQHKYNSACMDYQDSLSYDYKDKNFFIKSTKTQIAKAEPSQTQKVTETVSLQEMLI
jgi:hypothetical protein